LILIIIRYIYDNGVVWRDTHDGTRSRSHAPTTFDHTPQSQNLMYPASFPECPALFPLLPQ
jgi:hypothetical protein